MTSPHARRPRRARDARRAGVALLAVFVLFVLAVASGCGDSDSSTTPAAGATPTALQVMATATRGDLTQSATGQVKVAKSGGKLQVVATIDAQNAASVATGQDAAVFFMPAGGSAPQPQGSNMPQPGQSGMPQPGQSGMPAPGGSGMPQAQGGASGAPFPQGGQGAQGGFPGGAGGRGGLEGRVANVTTNADGTAAATISVDDLPSSVKAGSTGFARIEVKVLASDVILIPTAAVKGSGESATVQVISGGKTEDRTIGVGQQSGGMTEVVSGLEEGESVVYTQAFRGFPGGQGGQSGAPFPQGGQGMPQGGQGGMPVPQQDDQSGGSY
jgi:hypothetical protein